MDYADLIDGNITESELKAHLVEGENIAVTVRIPKKHARRGQAGRRALGDEFLLAGEDEPH